LSILASSPFEQTEDLNYSKMLASVGKEEAATACAARAGHLWPACRGAIERAVSRSSTTWPE
jgi:hypothetical protein